MIVSDRLEATATTATPRSEETRIRVRDVKLHVYEALVNGLPERTAIRLAYDGKDMEILVKGPIQNDYTWLLDRFVTFVAAALELPLSRWARRRGSVRRSSARARGRPVLPVRRGQARPGAATPGPEGERRPGLPQPRPGRRVDISRPQADRPGIYAVLRVPELWILDGGDHDRAPERGSDRPAGDGSKNTSMRARVASRPCPPTR